MSTQFVHLRLHTEYSLSDGLIRIKPLMQKVREFGMPALGITDQNNLFATVKFYQAAMNAGIKPIIGADILLFNEQNTTQPFHATLLCQNDQGYKNLLNLISDSYTKNQLNNTPLVTFENLAHYSPGLIALCGMQSDIGDALLNNETRLDNTLNFWQKHFNQRFYIEIFRNGLANEEVYLKSALQFAKKHSLPLVATNNVRFLEKDDFEAHEARVCIHQGYTLADPRRPKNYTDQQYLRSTHEMITLFADIPSALTNSVEIAKRCNVTLNFDKNYLPRFAVPEQLTTETHLIEEAKRGLDERLAVIYKNIEERKQRFSLYESRLILELDVINKMGFAGYFLIVADFIQWARNNDVPVGPGRGSGPGSLVAFALKITDLDPLAHDLLFERFLNPERVSMPDFDVDFCMEGRDRVIEYVMQKHGREKVAQIITYGSMAARAVLRDVGRVLGMGYGFVDKIAKLIPFEIGMTLERALSQEELLRQRYDDEDDVRTLFDLAQKLEGLTRNVGKHAGGVVIAPDKLTEFTALYCEQDQAEHVVTQFDKDDVEKVGLVKFDFLGLRTLTIIDWAVKRVKHLTNEDIDINLIPTNDAQTFEMLKECKTTAVFQLESRGMKDLIKRLQPDCFEDIVALVALFRPGPLQSGMVDDFINRKHGRAKVTYPHPSLEPILRPTYGVILYQEQVMQIAQVLAGYSLGGADLLRRAMGKKKPEEMAKQREIFCKGAINNGVNHETAKYIFDLMEKFAGYGFNRSHSASYALIAYQTAWLKAHFPAAYMAAVLSSDMDHTDKVVHFVEECQQLKITILPPNINQCEYSFKVIDDKTIAYGLGAIKGAGQAAIELLVNERNQNGAYTSLFDFCQRVDLKKVNRRVLEALIKAGSFDKLGPHRGCIIGNIDLAISKAEQSSRDTALGQTDLFGGMSQAVFEYKDFPAWSDQQRLSGEKETLGLYLSGHPIQQHLSQLKKLNINRIHHLQPAKNKNVKTAGIIISVRTILTKRGDKMGIFTLEDTNSQLDGICFAENFHKYRHLLIKDALVIVEGEVSLDDFSGKNRILAKEVYSLDEIAERNAKCLKIQFATNYQDEINKLAELLEPYRGGTCQVKINYTQNNASADLMLGQAWRVRPRVDLIKRIRKELGKAVQDVVLEFD